MTSDARGREGVKQNLMISDEGRRRGQAKSDVRCRKKRKLILILCFLKMTKTV